MFRFAVPVILIGVAIGGFFMYTSPLMNDINSIKAEMASYNEALANSKALESERDRLTKKYNSISTENLDRLNKFLPDTVDNIKLILEVEKIALPYGMVLRDVKYNVVKKEEKTDDKNTPVAANPEEVQKDYNSWDLAFSLQGSYYNFLNFTKNLESNLRVVDISSIAFSSDAGPGISLNAANNLPANYYKYDFKIKTYWLKN